MSGKETKRIENDLNKMKCFGHFNHKNLWNVERNALLRICGFSVWCISISFTPTEQRQQPSKGIKIEMVKTDDATRSLRDEELKKNEVLCMSNLSCIYETKTDNIVVVLPLTILLSFFGLQMDVIRSVEDDDYVDRPIKTMTALLLNVISPTKRNESQLRSLGLRFGCRR